MVPLEFNHPFLKGGMETAILDLGKHIQFGRAFFSIRPLETGGHWTKEKGSSTSHNFEIPLEKIENGITGGKGS